VLACSGSGRPCVVAAIFTIAARTVRAGVIRDPDRLTDTLGEVLFDSLLDALGLFDAESTDDRHVRTTFLELVKNPQERFIVWDEQDFVEGHLAEGN
jgi:hypothetical protein